jgi:hypothetical protein
VGSGRAPLRKDAECAAKVDSSLGLPGREDWSQVSTWPRLVTLAFQARTTSRFSYQSSLVRPGSDLPFVLGGYRQCRDSDCLLLATEGRSTARQRRAPASGSAGFHIVSIGLVNISLSGKLLRRRRDLEIRSQRCRQSARREFYTRVPPRELVDFTMLQVSYVHSAFCECCRSLLRTCHGLTMSRVRLVTPVILQRQLLKYVRYFSSSGVLMFWLSCALRFVTSQALAALAPVGNGQLRPARSVSRRRNGRASSALWRKHGMLCNAGSAAYIVCGIVCAARAVSRFAKHASQTWQHPHGPHSCRAWHIGTWHSCGGLPVSHRLRNADQTRCVQIAQR